MAPGETQDIRERLVALETEFKGLRSELTSFKESISMKLDAIMTGGTQNCAEQRARIQRVEQILDCVLKGETKYQADWEGRIKALETQAQNARKPLITVANALITSLVAGGMAYLIARLTAG